VLFPGLGDAIGFRLKLIQELTRSTPMHIVYKFMEFSLWQETSISPHLSSFQTNQQEVSALKVSVMVEFE